jgi:hypothetical protein
MTEGEAERMSAIMRRLGGALLQAIPEWWSDVTLRVEVRHSAEGTAISHSIASEQHPHDVVVGTDEVFVASRELQLLSAEAGEPWSAFVMRVHQENGAWKFKINFEYPAR